MKKQTFWVIMTLVLSMFISACGTVTAQKRVEGQVIVDVPAPRGTHVDSRTTSCVNPGKEVDDGEEWAATGTKGGGTHEVSGRRVFRAEKGTAYGGGGYGYYNESGTRCYYLSEVEAVKARNRR